MQPRRAQAHLLLQLLACLINSLQRQQLRIIIIPVGLRVEKKRRDGVTYDHVKK